MLKKVYQIILFLFLVLTIFNNYSCFYVKKINQTKAEFFDCRLKEESKIFQLNGQWNFYWDTLISPEEISATSIKPIKVKTIGSWTKNKINNIFLTKNGCATYNTKLLLTAGKNYLISLEKIYTTYKFYIGDSLYFSNGTLNCNAEKLRQIRVLDKKIYFTPQNDTVELTVQVSNYKNNFAGITKAIRVGDIASFETIDIIISSLDFLSYGALVIFAIFYFFIFLYTKHKENFLLFALLIVLSFIDLIHINVVYSYLHQNLSLFVIKIIDSLLYLAEYAFLILWVYNYTFEFSNKKLKTVLLDVLFVFFIISVILPDSYGGFIELLKFVVSITILIIFIIFLYKKQKTQKQIIWTFIGIIILSITAVNDFLSKMKILELFQVNNIGMFIFAALQGIYLSYLNTFVDKKEEELQKKSQIENEVKETLLKTPSYDVGSIISNLQKILKIEKTCLFTAEEDRFYFYLLSYLNTSPFILNEKLDFEEHTNSKFNIKLLKEAIDTKSDIFINDFNSTIEVKTILIIPIIQNDRIIAVIYFEDSKNYIEKQTFEIIVSLRDQIKILINTAVSYFKLININKSLDSKVKLRTEELEKQNKELIIKNSELDKIANELTEKNNEINELYDKTNDFIEKLEKQKNELEEQNVTLNEQNNQLALKQNLIQNNIQYARSILNFINIQEKPPFKDYFYIDIPKDIVGGDFYFAKYYGNSFIFALGDCTGHSVPGALMNMFANFDILKILNNKFAQNENIKTNEVLDLLRNNVKLRLNSSKDSYIRDGLDIALCSYNKLTKEITFSGAYLNLFIVRNGNYIVLKGDRMPIGTYIKGFEKPFQSEKALLQENDMLYILTDGYIDQFSSENNEKFYISRFKELILKINQFDLKTQHKILVDTFVNWKGRHFQIDDVSIIAIKI